MPLWKYLPVCLDRSGSGRKPCWPRPYVHFTHALLDRTAATLGRIHQLTRQTGTMDFTALCAQRLQPAHGRLVRRLTFFARPAPDSWPRRRDALDLDQRTRIISTRY